VTTLEPAPAPQALGDRLLAIWPLLFSFLVIASLYVWQASKHPTPWLFSDEIEYAQISRAIADTGRPARRGVEYWGAGLFPWLRREYPGLGPVVDRLVQDHAMIGSSKRGNQYVGENNTSEGSKMLIKLADEKDDRPIWVTVWGGGNTLAQAIWQVQKERSPEELKAFLHKLRVYTITDQDGAQKSGNVINWPESSHQWLRRDFEKDLLFIWDESAWLYQNSAGRSKWGEYEANIQGHGVHGVQLPDAIDIGANHAGKCRQRASGLKLPK